MLTRSGKTAMCFPCEGVFRLSDKTFRYEHDLALSQGGEVAKLACETLLSGPCASWESAKLVRGRVTRADLGLPERTVVTKSSRGEVSSEVCHGVIWRKDVFDASQAGGAPMLDKEHR